MVPFIVRPSFVVYVPSSFIVPMPSSDWVHVKSLKEQFTSAPLYLADSPRSVVTEKPRLISSDLKETESGCTSCMIVEPTTLPSYTSSAVTVPVTPSLPLKRPVSGSIVPMTLLSSVSLHETFSGRATDAPELSEPIALN